MYQTRKHMPNELQALQDRLRAILRANLGEARRTKELLRDTERKVEEQLGHLDFIETSCYIAGKKFRKEAIQASRQNDGIYRSAEHCSARGSLNTWSNAPRPPTDRVLQKSSPARDITPRP
jgi:hypothetical protein